jgi:hypothetical protein
MFSVILANPPYKAGLHLSFLEKSIDHGEHLLYLHPAEWLVQKKRETTPKRKKYVALRKKLMSIGTNITLIPNPWEEALIWMPLSITHVDRSSKQDLNAVTQWIDPYIERSFLDKVNGITPEWCSKYKNRSGQWYSSLSQIAGSGYIDVIYLDGVQRKIQNMFSITNSLCLEPTETPQKTRSGKTKYHIGFNTKDEAQNFIDFITKTVFMRAYIAIIKIDQNSAPVILKDIPFLDFTKQWDDTALYKFYGLDAAEIKMLNDIVNKISV